MRRATRSHKLPLLCFKAFLSEGVFPEKQLIYGFLLIFNFLHFLKGAGLVLWSGKSDLTYLGKACRGGGGEGDQALVNLG